MIQIYSLPLIMFLIISLSGIIINLIKNPRKNDILIESDAGSLLLFRLLFPLALVLGLIISYLQIGQYTAPVYHKLAAIILFAAGLIIRWAAVLTLKKAFTVKIHILKDQHLITHGIYKYIRHPAYTGLILYYTGFGLALQNYLALLLIIPVITATTLYRIRKEENVLLNHFGDKYLAYTQKTYRLFPPIY